MLFKGATGNLFATCMWVKPCFHEEGFELPTSALYRDTKYKSALVFPKAKSACKWLNWFGGDSCRACICGNVLWADYVMVLHYNITAKYDHTALFRATQCHLRIIKYVYITDNLYRIYAIVFRTISPENVIIMSLFSALQWVSRMTWYTYKTDGFYLVVCKPILFHTWIGKKNTR